MRYQKWVLCFVSQHQEQAAAGQAFEDHSGA